MIEKKKTLISIITVVLNGVEFLEEAFESVFSQSFTDYEYIVIDGGSTDGTIDIIGKYAENIEYWVSEPDNGVYDAMNKAIKVAKGRWLYFLGADDVLFDSLQQISAELLSEETIYYGDVFRPSLNRRYDGKFSAYKLASRNICHQAIFYPKQIFQKHSFNQRYKVFADHEFNMRCWYDHEIEFCYFPIIVAIFNDENGLSRTQGDDAFSADQTLLLKKYFSRSIYLMASLRFFLIKIFAFVKLDKIVLNLYHSYLRLFNNVKNW